MANVFGTSGNDFFHVSGDGHSAPGGYNEIADLTNGGDVILPGQGDDIVYAGSGDDVVQFGLNFSSADKIDGGAGFNGLEIVSLDQGDYSGANALVFGPDTMINIDLLALGGAGPKIAVYDLTTDDATVAAGQTLTVGESPAHDPDYSVHAGFGYTLTFDGSAETDGSFNIYGGTGNDTIRGGIGNDTIREIAGGSAHSSRLGGIDAAYGGAGNDLFIFKDTYTSADSIDGGAGHDRVTLNGAYDGGSNTPALVMSAATMTNVENLTLHSGFDYKITTNNATVGAGEQLLVDSTTLGASDILTFNGSAETDGHFVLRGGAANDILTGGLQGDTLTGNGGADRFTYTNVAQSASTLYDRVTDFDAASDKFDLNVSVTGIDSTQTGHLSVSTLDANLATAFTSSTLAAHHAALFTATSGGLSGHTFLVVDANGTPGYDAHADYVFDVTGIANAGSLAAGDFI